MSTPESLTIEVIQVRLPSCWSKLAALENFTGGRPWPACSHVVDGARGLLCVMHPAAGAQCRWCIPHHLRRHSDELEFACNECGAVVEEIHGLGVEAAAARLIVRDTKGRRRPMLGRLWLIGMGVCVPCWRESERRAA